MDKIFNNPDKEWASLVAQLVNNPPAMQETPVPFLGGDDPLVKGQSTHISILGPPWGSTGKESTCNESPGFDPWVGRSSGGGHAKPLQSFCLENPQGQRSLVGHSTGGIKESDMIE